MIPRSWHSPIVGLLIGLFSVPASAQISIYDDNFLEYWSAITPADIRAVYTEDLLPALSAEERHLIEGVTLSFPLRCPLNLEPFCYYLETLPGGQQRLVMSVESLRLFGDLALAMAWLQLNDHAIDTPGRYLAMLRHRRATAFPGGRYPEPMSALGIPAAVRDQPEVMGLYGKIYTSSIVFILLHELGHALHRHPGYGPELSREQARRNEVDADDFALEVMARLGYPPLGMSVFFTLLVHWEPNRWHFADEAAYLAHLAEATHPLTSDRLRNLASALFDRRHDFARAEPDYTGALARVSGVGEEIGRLADFMDDRDIQEGIMRLGRSTELESLKPRGVGELAIDRLIVAAEQPFAGQYQSNLRDESGELSTMLILERHGDRVTGLFTYGLGLGQIEGDVQQHRLYFGWTLGADQGQGVFELSEDGRRLQGTWGFGHSADNGGLWEAWRSD